MSSSLNSGASVRVGEAKSKGKRKNPGKKQEVPLITLDDETKDEVVLEEPPAEKKPRTVDDNELWKILKGKYMLGIYLCKGLSLFFIKIKYIYLISEDWDKLFHNKQKAVRSEDGRIAISFDMCEQCAWTNCIGTNLMAPPKKKEQ